VHKSALIVLPPPDAGTDPCADFIYDKSAGRIINKQKCKDGVPISPKPDAGTPTPTKTLGDIAGVIGGITAGITGGEASTTTEITIPSPSADPTAPLEAQGEVVEEPSMPTVASTIDPGTELSTGPNTPDESDIDTTEFEPEVLGG
jgi:hypothetical protein